MKRIKRDPLRSPPEMSDDEIRARPMAAVESARGVDVFPGGWIEHRNQASGQPTPAWVLRMRERGIDVREPRLGAVIEPFEAVRQAGPLLAFWRRALRRLRESRAVS
jgi:hypothetical protein